MLTPSSALPRSRVPVGSVPMKLPSMRLPTVSPNMSMPSPKRFMTRPLITLTPLTAVISSPIPPAPLPESSIFRTRVVARRQGIGGCSGLGVAVYGHRIGYGRQRPEAGRANGDGLHPRAWDVEVYGVSPWRWRWPAGWPPSGCTGPLREDVDVAGAACRWMTRRASRVVALTVKVVAAWAGAEASIPAAIIAAISAPAASAFAFLLHTNPSLLICVLIALCFLPFRLAAYVRFCSLAHAR